MHLSFLPYLKCPRSGSPLSLLPGAEMSGETVMEGVLTSGDHRYPIVRAIPRFVNTAQSEYAASFGKQWNRWSRVQFDEENESGPMKGHTSMMFERIIGTDAYNSLAGKCIVDIGVGAGRFADVASRRGAKVIGVDLSSAVEVSRRNISDHSSVLICQGDALNLPLQSGCLDGGYSIGVLHHTPAPLQGVVQLFECLKPSGWGAVAVYQKHGYYDSLRVKIWRAIFRLLAPIFKEDAAPLAYSRFVSTYFYPVSFVPGIGHLIRLLFPMVRLPDKSWRILDTFDSITPTYQSAHSAEEVRDWLQSVHAQEITQCDWGTSTWRGLKGAL